MTWENAVFFDRSAIVLEHNKNNNNKKNKQIHTQMCAYIYVYIMYINFIIKGQK